ncbi:MAG: hypothetical protein GX345_06105 [Clostridiales bacterium]|nr:hypothetical protein [Clostridiales bacterium]
MPVKDFFVTAYIDPGTGSMLVSALIASLSIVFYLLKDRLYGLLNPKGDKGKRLDPNRRYSLVYYSEGKQYWNVFKPLLEEGANRKLEALYLTSDKEDPGLEAQIEGVEAIYIGSGREAYYNLNRLNADLVVMTTPGLDVLEIKRSKNVKHYSHITHATSSSATYKAFGTDYYDSVLVGGEGTLELIRELEEVRNLPPKKIEIIGHTYLDVLRENLKENDYEYSLFKERKKTILISPTWGDHGLLTKYGETLLTALEKSNKYNVIIRPHPQSFISDKEVMNRLLEKFPENESRVWNTDRENPKALAHADIMISDFSGIIFDFYTLFKKPILTIRGQYEKRGREAMDLKEEPWDLRILDKIGKTLDEDDFKNLTEIIDETIEGYSSQILDEDEMSNIVDKYPNQAADRGLNFIEKTLESLNVRKAESTEIAKRANYLNEDFTFNPHLGESKPWPFKLLTTVFDTGFLLQAGFACIFFLLCIALGLKLTPDPGRNFDFLKLLNFYASILTIGIFIALFTKVLFFKKGHIRLEKSYEGFNLADVLFILLPMLPIVQYIFANQDILTFYDSFILLRNFSLVTLFFVVVVPLFLSPLIAKVFTLPISSVFLFMLLNMASMGNTISPKRLMLLMLFLLLIAALLLFIQKKKILLILLVVLFIGNSAFSFKGMVSQDSEMGTMKSSNKIIEHTADLEVKNTPDIFIMIYDAYPNQETMEAYGIDNSEQMDYLLDLGFAIYDGTYSIGCNSLMSMSQVLHFDHAEDYYEAKKLLPKNYYEFRKLIAGEALGLKFLRYMGYKNTILVESNYYFRGFNPQYDRVFPPTSDSIPGYKIIGDAIIEGEFRFDARFSSVTKKEFLNEKREILSQNLPEPEFLYHHVTLPSHRLNFGTLLPDETEKYLERLEKANLEMNKDLDDMMLKNRDAIVIIAGDHGPYLTKNELELEDFYDISEIDRLDVQDRHGAFLAIYWPDPSYAKNYDIKTIQDVLPAAISYMYDDDSLFAKIKMTDRVEDSFFVSGVSIVDGIIVGGIDDGKPLFENVGVRVKE